VRRLPYATAVALFLGLACDPRQPVAPAGARQVTVQGLEQTVQLFPAEPAQGEELHILSVVVNRKSDSAAVQSRICGLDTKGDLELTGARFMCAGYSIDAALAPGDSVTGNDFRVVASAPGQYTLRVRHLLTPDTWVEVPVVVH
jgi:hypothetical protein